jgi:hypothetical protein
MSQTYHVPKSIRCFQTNNTVQKPILNLTSSLHHYDACSLFNLEYDGYHAEHLNKMYINSPEPYFYKPIFTKDNKESQYVQLHSALFFLEIQHEQEQMYTFSSESENMLQKYFNLNKDITHYFALHGDNISLMYIFFLTILIFVILFFLIFTHRSLFSSTYLKVIRLAIILASLKQAYILLKNVSSSYHSRITQQLENECKEIIKLKKYSFKVDQEETELAIAIMNYYNVHHIIMMGYSINEEITLHQFLSSLAPG